MLDGAVSLSNKLLMYSQERRLIYTEEDRGALGHATGCVFNEGVVPTIISCNLFKGKLIRRCVFLHNVLFSRIWMWTGGTENMDHGAIPSCQPHLTTRLARALFPGGVTLRAL